MNHYVGRVFPTNGGTDCLVIRYNSAKDVVVQFTDDYKYESKVTISNLLKGNVKNPYSKTVHGVGYVGVGKFKSRINGKLTEHYAVWSNMIKRGYCYDFKRKHPTYKNCTVSKDWHNFQVFAKWYTEHRFFGLGYELDKDLKFLGNKVYSEHTCTLVPKTINTLLSSREPLRNGHMQGVHFDKKRGKYRAYVNRHNKRKLLGDYNTKEDAAFAVKLGKEAQVKVVALEWEGKIEDAVFNNLMSLTL